MSALWVFGYGSLIWNPGFGYKECKIGRIDGFCRRFYQGSDTHRGNQQRLGRVVTLMEEEGVSTWGRAFQFTDEATTLAYLTNRESSIGGYNTIITQFHPRDPKEDPFPVLVYIALPCNPLFLGSAPLEQIAEEIAFAEGICGPNVEYLAKLSAFMRFHCPQESDEHLYRLEVLVKTLLNQKCLENLFKLFEHSFMHELEEQMIFKAVISSSDDNQTQDNSYQRISSTSSSVDSNDTSGQPPKYTDRVTARKLRCINK